MSGTIKQPPTDHLQSLQPGQPSVTFENFEVHGKEINCDIFGTLLTCIVYPSRFCIKGCYQKSSKMELFPARITIRSHFHRLADESPALPPYVQIESTVFYNLDGKKLNSSYKTDSFIKIRNSDVMFV